MKSTSDNRVALYLVVAISLALGWYVRQRAQRRALPPGPRKLPFVGNAFDFNRGTWLAKLSEWHNTYGDLVYLRLFNRSMLVLNTLEAALDLQEKRATLYSDRPRRVMAELSGYDQVTVLRGPYDDVLKTGKKYLHLELRRASMEKHAARQEDIAQQFCELLKKDPGAFVQHSRACTVSVIRSIIYGDQAIFDHIHEADKLSADVLDQFTKMTSPSEFLVDSLPILRYLPEWFPGAVFQREARQSRIQINRFINEPYHAVKQQVAEGLAPSCFLSDILSDRDLSPENEDILKKATASAYGAGFDTSTSLVSAFFLAMVLFPEVQARGQAELDQVIGPGGMPSFADRASLPYIEAIVSEVLRTRPPVPFAWRSLRDDDTYRGYTIPRGTLVTVNVRALTHNPSWYPDPDEFRPERFIDAKGQYRTDVPDPRQFIFGFGRRSCPGNFLADNFLFIVAATTLASVSISPVCDDDGVPILPDTDYCPPPGGICHPAPFECNIVPRA